MFGISYLQKVIYKLIHIKSGHLNTALIFISTRPIRVKWFNIDLRSSRCLYIQIKWSAKSYKPHQLRREISHLNLYTFYMRYICVIESRWFEDWSESANNSKIWSCNTQIHQTMVVLIQFGQIHSITTLILLRTISKKTKKLYV